MTPPAAALLSQLGVAVRALSPDSRAIGAETAFLAYPGECDDGRRHIGAALAAGAAGVFWEEEGFAWPHDWQTPNVPVHNLKMRCGHLADAVYGEPSRHLPVVAVTGTNGKTTVSHLLAQLLQQGGVDSGMVGTLGAGVFGSDYAPLPNTTPDAATLHHWLRQFVAAGSGAAVVEASSHGIHQGRLHGVRLAAAVFTNAARDHLDYHGSVESYWQAKAELFKMPQVGAAVLNADDAFSVTLRAQSAAPLLTYGKQGEDLRLLTMEVADKGWHLTLDGILGRCSVHLPLPGVHNVYNFLAALLTSAALKMLPPDLSDAAARLTLPPGRLQVIHRAPTVVVDYAHTADAMRAALTAARELAGDGRLILVFGAGGGRDQGKRAAMGEAARAADVVFVTDDNPRDEDAAQIRAQLAAAVPAAENIAGRRAAIAAALAIAQRGDTVLLCGKGHETTQHSGGEVHHFSDVEVARDLLAAREGV